MGYKEDYIKYGVRPDVMNYDDLREMVPALDGHPRIVKFLMKLIKLDRVNKVHGAVCDTPGAEFSRRLIEEQFNIKVRVDNADILDNLPEGAFITVSNHPFGALDGIILIYLIGQRRPEYKLMVNLLLNKLSGMRPNFIAVDAMASDDPAKKAVSVAGIRSVIRQLAEGKPVGFFPAGAMSKTTWKDGLQDRPWQDSVLQLIKRAKVPVIPIYFHGTNRWYFNLLGHICWPLRSLLLPRELFHKCNTTVHVSIGEPIPVEEQAKCATVKELGDMLRKKTYDLRAYR